ncbi:hypothetical protein B6S44_11220 [Bosea sp. Tri-44]|uniref:hypothetical protein n=1 Tax=Bosea sp. Tri-44 TaxID=1972137 RepID=UPI00100F6507|nr:hypothetical protein [Bosea sp. Tri-44]RXT55173.1 hypothetical protein B6S44_11220 [Bosea sp. Tri-44]
MIPIAQLINNGFEIKSSTTATVKGEQEMYVILQKGPDAYLCLFRFNGNGWPQAGGWPLG